MMCSCGWRPSSKLDLLDALRALSRHAREFEHDVEVDDKPAEMTAAELDELEEDVLSWARVSLNCISPVRGEPYAAGVRCAHLLWLIEQARANRAAGAELLDEVERQRRDG